MRITVDLAAVEHLARLEAQRLAGRPGQLLLDPASPERHARPPREPMPAQPSGTAVPASCTPAPAARPASATSPPATGAARQSATPTARPHPAPSAPPRPPWTQETTGITVPPALSRVLARAARLGLAELDRRDGGLPAVPGLAALLDELGAVASARPLAMVEARPVTAAEAAAAAGVSPQRIRQLCASGQLIARRHGRDWLIDPDSAAAWKSRRTR